MRIPFQSVRELGYFVCGRDDFAELEIRDTGSNGLHYFVDRGNGARVTGFVLQDNPRVALMCDVTLIKKEGAFSPRFRVWKRDKTKAGREVATEEASGPPEVDLHTVKASVDLDGGQDNFWALVSFLHNLAGVRSPAGPVLLAHDDQVQLLRLLADKDKEGLLGAIQEALGSDLTERDLTVLLDRRAALEHFGRLLHEEGFFDAEHTRLGGNPEKVWQDFFEANAWIFGYGLTLVSHTGLDARRLEQVTSGQNVFAGAGKRSDALLRSNAAVSTLLFTEIKRHDTPLLAGTPYREPDVYRPGNELVGGVAQLQKTVRKALREIRDQIKRHILPDGTPTAVEYSTSKPRQVLLIGSLAQFVTDGQINGEKMESFELYRRSITDIEVLTFDELYERTRFIVGEPS